MYSQRRAFPLLCCPRAGMEGLNEIRKVISSKYLATKKLQYNLQKETRGSGFCWTRVPAQEDKQQRWIIMPWLTSQKMQLSKMEI